MTLSWPQSCVALFCNLLGQYHINQIPAPYFFWSLIPLPSCARPWAYMYTFIHQSQYHLQFAYHFIITDQNSVIFLGKFDNHAKLWSKQIMVLFRISVWFHMCQIRITASCVCFGGISFPVPSCAISDWKLIQKHLQVLISFRRPWNCKCARSWEQS